MCIVTAWGKYGQNRGLGHMISGLHGPVPWIRPSTVATLTSSVHSPPLQEQRIPETRALPIWEAPPYFFLPQKLVLTGVAGLMVPDGQSCIPKKVPEVGLDSALEIKGSGKSYQAGAEGRGREGPHQS